MSSSMFIVEQISPEIIKPTLMVAEELGVYLDSYEVVSNFSQEKHQIELHIYTLGGTLLFSEPYYKGASELLNAKSAGKTGASVLTLFPEKDVIKYGFDTGDVIAYYNFKEDLISKSKDETVLHLVEISPDRKELKLISLRDDIDVIEREVLRIKGELESSSTFVDFKVNFKNNLLLSGVNIGVLPFKSTKCVTVKLAEELPVEVEVNTRITIERLVSDPVAFKVVREVKEDPIKYKSLRGPNFEIEEKDTNYTPSSYLNFNELFSYPISNNYYELRSLFNEKSTQISVDHNKLEEFIHFSSAEERLRNFKYKLELIESYEEKIELINTSTDPNKIQESKEYFENLIEGVVSNFDHYDRFLYYESGSNSWPKSNLTRPYVNIKSDTPQAIEWFNSKVEEHQSYDIQNYDLLTNTIPAFIREDENNEPYIMFILMIGHHFDNLWIYHKALSKKHDGDNRLNHGISKDLVRDAIESFGIKLYDSSQNLDSIFSSLTGEFVTGSKEVINTTVIATQGGFNEYLQPMPKDNYNKEIYKRIYHNLPLLLKTKGTQRGLRALINCFGIPSDILTVNVFGGVDSFNRPFTDPHLESTSSLEKVRTYNTGSIVEGNTLSNNTSIEKRNHNFTQDTHTVEVGFSTAAAVDKYILANIDPLFNIDNFIGDPRDRFKHRYKDLDRYSKELLGNITNFSIINFVRLVKFFDNSLFRLVREFIPARSNASTGIIVKPPILNISKAKSVETTWENFTYSSSIDIGIVSGSHGTAFGSRDQYETKYKYGVSTQFGILERQDHNQEQAKFDGEFSGSILKISDGELNRENRYKKYTQPLILFDLTFIEQLPIECQILFTVSLMAPTPTPTVTVTPTPTPTVTPVVGSIGLFGPTAIKEDVCTLSQNPITYYYEGASYLLPGTRFYLDALLTQPMVGVVELNWWKTIDGDILIIDRNGYLVGLGSPCEGSL